MCSTITQKQKPTNKERKKTMNKTKRQNMTREERIKAIQRMNTWYAERLDDINDFYLDELEDDTIGSLLGQTKCLALAMEKTMDTFARIVADKKGWKNVDLHNISTTGDIQ